MISTIILDADLSWLTADWRLSFTVSPQRAQSSQRHYNLNLAFFALFAT